MTERVDRRHFLRGAARASLAGAIAPSALLAACGGGTSGNGSKTTITWSYWGDPAENQVNLKVKSAFEKDNPDIQVNVLWAPWTQYFQKIDGLFAGGAPPDVLFLTFIQKYAAEGVIEDLSSWIQKGGVDLGGYWPGFNDAMKYKGKLYGLQRDGDVKVLYYNTDHLQQAGVPRPDKTWTWDTFERALARLTQKDGGRVQRYGLAMESAMYWLWLAMNGTWTLDDARNPSRCTLDDPRAVQALQWQANLIKQQYLLPVDLQQSGSDAGAFQSGQASMIIQNVSRVPTFNQQGSLKYGLAPIPRPAGGQYADSAGGAGFSISSKSKHKDAAWKFLSWLQSPRGQSLFAQSGDLFPALKSVAESQSYLKTLPDDKNALSFMAQYGKTIGTALFPEWNELSTTLIVPALQKIWTGEHTVGEVVPGLVQQVNDYLKKHGYPKSS
jgi:multiple sugar transport system substrate-binding protein